MKLKSVPKPEDEPVDLYTGWKAEIASRDWAKVMIEGDKNKPLPWFETRRTWMK